MQEKISFNQISFVNEIKNALQRLETDTDAKLRSLMTAEANTNANTNANTCFVKSVKKFKDAVNICDINQTAVSKDKFPEDVYVAVMQRVIAVEAPKISGGSFNEGAIIKQLGAYISELLDSKTEKITVGDKTYELSNPSGSTNSTVTVTVNGNKYIFSWNDDSESESLNSFMKSLAEFEKENMTAVFFAILKDAKKFSASSNSNSSDMLSKWIKALTGGGKAKSLSHLNGFEYFRQLSLKLKSTSVTGDLISLATDVFDTLKPFLEIYKNLQSPNKKAIKLLEKIESVRGTAESVKQFLSFTKEIFTGSGNTISNIIDKYDKLLDKATNFVTYISEHENSSAETLTASSEYKNFVSAFNNLESAIDKSSTAFGTMLDECKVYEYSDVTTASISQSRALINGTGSDDKILAEGSSVTLNGNAGNDTLMTAGGYTYVNGGQGDDVIYTEGNHSFVNGGQGNDVIYIGGNHSSADGEQGSDTIVVAASDVTVDGGINFDFLLVPDKISLGSNVEDILIKNFEYADTLDLSEYNVNELSAGKYQNTSLEIWSRKTRKTIAVLEDVTGGSDKNILCTGNDGLFVAVSLDWILANTPPIINPYDALKPSRVVNVPTNGTVNNTVDSMMIYAPSGKNSINNSGSLVTIDGGDGSDTIKNYGDNITIDGGAGNDSIYNYGDSVTIDAGVGNDSIWNYSDWGDSNYIGGTNVSINAGDGNDYILNNRQEIIIGYEKWSDEAIISFYEYSTIDGGTGSDTIDNYGDGVTIEGGAGNDRLDNWGNKVTIRGGSGKDFLRNNNRDDSVILDGGSDNDSIRNFGSNSTLVGGDGDDTIGNYKFAYDESTNKLKSDNGAFNVTIIGGVGKDSIYNSGFNALIETGDDDDTIDNGTLDYNSGGAYVTIDAGDGNDRIHNGGNYVTITTGAGDDTITNDSGGTNVLIDTGAGNDSIKNYGNNVIIDAGEGYDYIYNYNGDNVSIDANTGNDFISNRGSNVSINSGFGNDSVSNIGERVTVNAGDGNDYIYNGGDSVTVNAGDGNDSICNGGNSVTVNAGDGNDSIQNYGDSVTIDGGAGNDFVDLGSYYSNFNVIQYTSGDGNDTIYGFDEDDTLQIVGGTYSTQTTDDDLILNVGTGKIIIVGAANKTLNIDGEKISEFYWRLDGTTATYGTANETLVTVSGVKSLDGLSVDGKVVTVSAAALNKTKISISGDGYTLALGSDVAKPSTKEAWNLSGSTATLKQTTSDKYSLASNAKFITHSAKTTTTLAIVKGVKSLDGLSVDGKVVTVSAAALNKTKISISGDGYTLALGSDVAKPSTKEAWNLSGSTATLKQTTSDKYSLASNAKSITHSAKTTTTLAIVKGVKSLDGLSVDGKVVTVSAAALNKTKISISGDGYTLALGSDVAKPSTKEAWSLSGSTATLKQTTSDKYSLASNAKSITHSAKTTTTLAIVKGVKSLDGLSVDGKVVTVSAAALNKTKISISGDGYTLALGSDVAKPSTKEAWSLSGSTATLKQTTSDKYSLASNAKSITHSAKKTTTLAIVKGVKSLEGLSAKENIVKLKADTLNKKVTVSGGGCEFDFAAGNYNGAVVNASSNNDVITSRGKNLSVSGGAGHDSINVFGTATTVTGGSGNDSLTSGLGGNVFVYASGDGNDIIANFAENDKIKVTKGTPEVTSNGSDVIVKVGKGSIKLSEATGQNISVINSKGAEKIYKPTDYWFMADTPAAAAELSSFVENYSEDYPLAEFETPTPLTQKNILLTATQSNKRQ